MSHKLLVRNRLVLPNGRSRRHSDHQVLRRLVPAPSRLALDVSCAVAGGLLELAFPVAITLLLDRLLPPGDLGLRAELHPQA
ncbi:hypothetical protein [Foliimonas ilicis]